MPVEAPASTHGHHSAALDHIQRWVARIAALAIPVSEGGLQIALAVLLVVGVLRQGPALRTRPPILSGPFLREHAPAVLVVVGLLGWILIGLASGAAQGYTPRFSHLNKAVMAFAIVVGALVWERMDAAELRNLFWWLVAGTAIATLTGLLQVSVGTFPLESLITGDRGRMSQLYVPGTDQRAATGTLLNRLKSSETLLFAAAALSAAAASVASRRSRWLAYGGLALTCAMVALTFAKAAVLALALGILATGLLRRSRAFVRYLVPGVLIGSLCAAALVAVVAATPPATNGVPQGSVEVRRYIWKSAAEMFRENPVFGVGIGSYESASPQYPGRSRGTWQSSAHNHHLTVLAEGGLVGFAFWLAVCAGMVLALRRSWSWKPDALTPARRWIRHVSTFYLLAMLPLTFVHDVLFHPGTAVLVWLSVGGIVGWQSPAQPDER